MRAGVMGGSCLHSGLGVLVSAHAYVDAVSNVKENDQRSSPCELDDYLQSAATPVATLQGPAGEDYV